MWKFCSMCDRFHDHAARSRIDRPECSSVNASREDLDWRGDFGGNFSILPVHSHSQSGKLPQLVVSTTDSQLITHEIFFSGT